MTNVKAYWHKSEYYYNPCWFHTIKHWTHTLSFMVVYEDMKVIQYHKENKDDMKFMNSPKNGAVYDFQGFTQPLYGSTNNQKSSTIFLKIVFLYTCGFQSVNKDEPRVVIRVRIASGAACVKFSWFTTSWNVLSFFCIRLSLYLWWT